MISNLEMMESPGVMLGSSAIVFLKDRPCGHIEVVAAKHITPAIVQTACSMVRGDLARGRSYRRSEALEKLMGLPFILCTPEYEAAHAQELPSALRQAKLLRERLRRLSQQARILCDGKGAA